MPAGHEDDFRNSNFYHQTHLRTFLVQNSVLNKKLSNLFFVTIMYFFYHKKISMQLLVFAEVQTPKSLQKSNHFISPKLRKSVQKAKRQKFSEMTKCQMRNITKWVVEEVKIKPISPKIFQRLYKPVESNYIQKISYQKSN